MIEIGRTRNVCVRTIRPTPRGVSSDSFKAESAHAFIRLLDYQFSCVILS
jgi:hypothetical protein